MPSTALPSVLPWADLPPAEPLELIAQHSGRTLAEIQRDWDRDRWFTAEQAREYGLIDQVITAATQLPTG